MSSLAFWRAVVDDTSGFLEGIIALLEEQGVRYCVIGGVGVNAYSEPVVTQDLDVVVAVDDLGRLTELLADRFAVREFPFTLNVREPGSGLQVQIQLRQEFQPFIGRAERKTVMGLWLPIANSSDLVDSKIEAALSPHRRGSKRLKDITDIRRLVDAFPEFRERIPAPIAPLVFFDE